MNQFELFTMVYYVLDAEWDETTDPKLGDFLSEMNPFLFEDIGSANPEIYQRFCQLIPSVIDQKDSYR